jgi:hypothetical protein
MLFGKGLWQGKERPYSTWQCMSTSTRCAIIERDERICCWCLVGPLSKEQINLDHIKPRNPPRQSAKKGETNAKNLVVACIDCNHARSNGDRGSAKFFSLRLALYFRTIADGNREAKRRVALPLPREEGRKLAREWYPGRLEYLSPKQRISVKKAQRAKKKGKS